MKANKVTLNDLNLAEIIVRKSLTSCLGLARLEVELKLLVCLGRE